MATPPAAAARMPGMNVAVRKPMTVDEFLA